MVRSVEHYPSETIVVVIARVRKAPKRVKNATVHEYELEVWEVHKVVDLTENVPFTVYDAENINRDREEVDDEDDDGSGLPRSRSLVLFDPARISGTRDFRVLSRRDLEDIWGKVLEGCRSNVLRQLLSSQGTLMALFVARGTCRSGFSAFSVISLVMKYQSILKPRWIHIPLLTSVRLVSPFFDTTW